MSLDELAQRVNSIARLTGTFTLRSGQIATEYFDKYRFEADPILLADIARALVPLLPAGTEVLAGLELGGVPIATALSLQTGLPAAFVRKEAKTYGTAQLAEGADIVGKRVTVIEDVITTGGSTREVADSVSAAGAKVLAAGSIIDRSGGRADVGVPRVALETLEAIAYQPEECPLCRQGLPLVKPGSRRT